MEFPFVLVPVLLGAVFLLVLGAFVFYVVRGVSEWAENKRTPVETVSARVVTKRTEVRGAVGPNYGGNTMTLYYCTFELEDGERLEFAVAGQEYGLLVEGDRGTLTHRGTRYQGFRRHLH